jgi:hypothetical protein
VRHSDLATSIPDLIKTRPSVIMLADIGRMPPTAQKALAASVIQVDATIVRVIWNRFQNL